MPNRPEHPPFAIGDLVVTDFYPKDRKLIRKVVKVYRTQGASQSGWTVSTKDEFGRIMSVDSDWYKRADHAQEA